MSLIYFDIIRIATATSYTYGTLATLPSPNGKVYMCRAAGVSASVLPALTTVSGSTFTDGTVEWLEYTPTGSTYSTTIQFVRNPKYGNVTKNRSYVQTVDYSAGGDAYVYDLGISAINKVEMRWPAQPTTELNNLLDFIGIVRGAKFPFNYYDENGAVHKVIISNSNQLDYEPVEGSDIQQSPNLELLFLST